MRTIELKKIELKYHFDTYHADMSEFRKEFYSYKNMLFKVFTPLISRIRNTFITICFFKEKELKYGLEIRKLEILDKKRISKILKRGFKETEKEVTKEEIFELTEYFFKEIKNITRFKSEYNPNYRDRWYSSIKLPENFPYEFLSEYDAEEILKERRKKIHKIKIGGNKMYKQKFKEIIKNEIFEKGYFIDSDDFNQFLEFIYDYYKIDVDSDIDIIASDYLDVINELSSLYKIVSLEVYNQFKDDKKAFDRIFLRKDLNFNSEKELKDFIYEKSGIFYD